jgi:hypothetical protein
VPRYGGGWSESGDSNKLSGSGKPVKNGHFPKSDLDPKSVYIAQLDGKDDELMEGESAGGPKAAAYPGRSTSGPPRASNSDKELGAIKKKFSTLATATVEAGSDPDRVDGRERAFGKADKSSGGEAPASFKPDRMDDEERRDEEWLQQRRDRRKKAQEQRDKTKRELEETLWKTEDLKRDLRNKTQVDMDQVWTALFTSGSASFLTSWSDLRTRLDKEGRAARKDELKSARGLAVRVIRDWKGKQKVWPRDAPSKSGKPPGFPPKTNTASGPHKPGAGYLTPALGFSSQAGKMDPPSAPGGKRGRKSEREREHRPRPDYSGGSSSGTEPPAKTIGIQRSSRALSRGDQDHNKKPLAFRIPKNKKGKSGKGEHDERDPSLADKDPSAKGNPDADLELLENDEPPRNPYVIHVYRGGIKHEPITKEVWDVVSGKIQDMILPILDKEPGRIILEWFSYKDGAGILAPPNVEEQELLRKWIDDLSVTDKDGTIDDFHGWIEGEDGDFTPLTTKMPFQKRQGVTAARILTNWCQQAKLEPDQFRVREIVAHQDKSRIMRFSAKKELVNFLKEREGIMNFCGTRMEIFYHKKNIKCHTFEWEANLEDLLLDDVEESDTNPKNLK